jgi:hypothetical protein
MIKTAIKLAIVALVVNASWQLFNVYWPYYKFKDAVTFTTQFRGTKSDEQIRTRILELAAQFDVPLDEENLTVREAAKRTTVVDASYVQKIDLAPGFKYPWPFTLHVETFAMAADDLTPK